MRPNKRKKDEISDYIDKVDAKEIEGEYGSVDLAAKITRIRTDCQRVWKEKNLRSAHCFLTENRLGTKSPSDRTLLK